MRGDQDAKQQSAEVLLHVEQLEQLCPAQAPGSARTARVSPNKGEPEQKEQLTAAGALQQPVEQRSSEYQTQHLHGV